MAERFSFRSDSEPTMPHLPALPPDDEPASLLPQRAATPPTTQTGRSDGPYGGGTAYLDPYAAPFASPARERERRRRSQRRSNSGWAWVIVALALFGVTLVISLSVFLLLRGSGRGEVATGAPMASAYATAVVAVPTIVPNLQLPTDVGQAETALPPAAGSGIGLSIQPWDGEERFTILVMGWDRRPGETGSSFRTDTMMLVSLDPDTDSIGILSIPRDLYVEIPGYREFQRVNSAVVLGELLQPGYGVQLAMQTVQYNLGIRVNDYLLVDFSTFVTLIDLIGGIDVNVPYTINDPLYPDMNYGYDPFYLPAGWQHLDGATALKYARSRHSSNDFDRIERQQQVLYAVRDRVLSFDMLPQLAVNAPTLWAQIQNGVQTGLTLDQLLTLAWYAKDIPDENIHTGIIDTDYTSFYTTPSGSSVLIPDRWNIGQLMVQVFGPNYYQ